MTSKQRSGFTLVELLVVIAIIGILVALLLPAVQAAREASRRMSCSNNLKQLGLAVHNYHDSNKQVPAARWLNHYGTWFATILPYVESSAEYDQWFLEEEYYAVVNTPARENLLSLYRCATRPEPRLARGRGSDSDSINPLGATGDYAGNAGNNQNGGPDFWRPEANGVIITARIFDNNPGEELVENGWLEGEISFKSITDGLSNTFLAGERHVPTGSEAIQDSIYNGDHANNIIRVAGLIAPIANSADDLTLCSNGCQIGSDSEWCTCDNFGSWHPGVCQFVLADGHVKVLSSSADLRIVDLMAARNDGIPMPKEL